MYRSDLEGIFVLCLLLSTFYNQIIVFVCAVFLISVLIDRF